MLSEKIGRQQTIVVPRSDSELGTKVTEIRERPPAAEIMRWERLMSCALTNSSRNTWHGASEGSACELRFSPDYSHRLVENLRRPSSKPDYQKL